MKTHKLLELSALLKQYADEYAGTRQLMAKALHAIVSDEAKQSEKENEKRK